MSSQVAVAGFELTTSYYNIRGASSNHCTTRTGRNQHLNGITFYIHKHVCLFTFWLCHVISASHLLWHYCIYSAGLNSSIFATRTASHKQRYGCLCLRAREIGIGLCGDNHCHGYTYINQWSCWPHPIQLCHKPADLIKHSHARRRGTKRQHYTAGKVRPKQIKKSIGHTFSRR